METVLHSEDWARVPAHLLDLILEKLRSTRDYLQFGAVCDSWNSITKDSRVVHTDCVPMLLIPNRDEPTCSVYNVLNSHFVSSEVLVSHTKRFSGSSLGWLVAVNDDWTISLYKPFSMDPYNNHIQLPCLFPPAPEGIDDYEEDSEYEDDQYTDLWTLKDYHIKKVVITTENPTIIAFFGESEELAFIRLHKDSTWTKIKIEDDVSLGIEDLVQFGNQIYVVATCGQVYSFDLVDPHNSILRMVNPCIDELNSAFVKRYLVESYHGKLYQLRKYTEIVNDYRSTTRIDVLSLDPDNGEWIDVESLDNETLFLGDNSSQSIRASDFAGCQPNCIYFTHDFNRTDVWTTPLFSDAGIYDMQTKEFRMHFTFDLSTLTTTKIIRPPIWIVPTINA